MDTDKLFCYLAISVHQCVSVASIELLQNPDVHIVRSSAEQNEDDLLDSGIRFFEMRRNLADRDFSGRIERIAVDTGADRGEADGAGAALFGQRQAGSVAAGEQLRLPVAAVAVDWADRVE